MAMRLVGYVRFVEIGSASTMVMKLRSVVADVGDMRSFTRIGIPVIGSPQEVEYVRGTVL